MDKNTILEYIAFEISAGDYSGNGVPYPVIEQFVTKLNHCWPSHGVKPSREECLEFDNQIQTLQDIERDL